jgi:hypothetical protein
MLKFKRARPLRCKTKKAGPGDWGELQASSPNPRQKLAQTPRSQPPHSPYICHLSLDHLLSLLITV